MVFNDKRGNPVLQDIDPYFENYKYYINYGAEYPLKRSTRDRGMTLDESMNAIDLLLDKYEMLYYPHLVDKTLLYMPCLFRAPDEGAKMINTNTQEIYTIEDIIVNPKTKKWEGLLRLNPTNSPPDKNELHKLRFLDDRYRVRFVQEYPNTIQYQSDGQNPNNEEIDKGPIIPTITNSLIRKEPGSISGSPFGPEKNYRMRTREYIKDPANPGHTLQYRGQYFDCLVQFDCWTTDNFSANKLASWFERFVSLYTPILKRNGVVDIILWQRLRDAAVTKWRQDLISRTLQYYFRIEDVEILVRKDLVYLNMDFNVIDELADLSKTYIAGQEISAPGQLTTDQYHALFQDSDGNYLFGDIDINDGNLT